MKNDHAITSILSIYSEAQSEAINERIERGQDFTVVTDIDPRMIAPSGVALLCLHDMFQEDLQITHVCILKKQNRVATNQVRLKGIDAIKIPSLEVKEVIAELPNRFKKLSNDSFSVTYKKVSKTLGEVLFKRLIELLPDNKDDIEKLLDADITLTGKTTKPRTEDAAIEKDALGICLDIFGIDRSPVLRNWDALEGAFGDSFLTGLHQYIAYEDDIISNDLHSVPGWEFISESITGVAEFKNTSGEKLLVINANRKPQEKATGVDLIYFHRAYEAFTLVQYKMMESRKSDDNKLRENQFYNPNQISHKEELKRMRELRTLVDNEEKGKSLNDYRFSTNSIFFKLCKKLQMRKDDTSIVPGAYIPLNQWEILIDDKSTLGPNGGRQISYDNLNKRYIGTQTFIELVQKGLIGTQSSCSKKIGAFIQTAIQNGHSVMYAIEERKELIKKPLN